MYYKRTSKQALIEKSFPIPICLVRIWPACTPLMGGSWCASQQLRKRNTTLQAQRNKPRAWDYFNNSDEVCKIHRPLCSSMETSVPLWGHSELRRESYLAAMWVTLASWLRHSFSVCSRCSKPKSLRHCKKYTYRGLKEKGTEGILSGHPP